MLGLELSLSRPAQAVKARIAPARIAEAQLLAQFTNWIGCAAGVAVATVARAGFSSANMQTERASAVSIHRIRFVCFISGLPSLRG